LKGSEVTVTCPKCHSENSETKQFCGDCGTQIVPPSREIHPEVTETLQAPVRELTTGSTFAGRYQIIEELGKGAMGRVYKVFDTKIKEKVALKLIKPEIASDRETIERFSNELRLSRRISHRNVCRMFDLGEAEGDHFITMEYVSGEDLKSFLHRVGQLPVGKAISISKQVCDGLAEAHRLGVVHRDLKPSNVMIDKDGNARIMDFGIARSVSARGITGAGVIIGTPEYMSPEQVEGKETDPRSDIYSLGVILYEMITGRLPFEGDTALSIAVKHKTEIPRDPREFNRQIPEELSRLILKCMEKEKERRYQRVDEILSALVTIESLTPTTGIAAGKVPDTKKILEAEWKKSIAVLPFSNLSPEREQDYFCDGLTEEIINALSHVRELRVVARTSAFAFKGKEIDIREVGEKLNVDAVLEGSVRKAGDRLRITAQLINVADGYHLWSERFDRAMKDVFDIQDEVTLEIIDKLKIELLGKEKEQVVKRYTDNPEAYNLYLQGQCFCNTRTEVGLKKGLDYFQQAIEKDPAYALAYVGLAHSYIVLAGYEVLHPKDAYPKAKAATMKALEMDDMLADAYVSLATIKWENDLDPIAAEKDYKKAIEINPGLAYAHKTYAEVLSALGRHGEAIKEIKLAQKLDPLSLITSTTAGGIYYHSHNYDQAIKEIREVLDKEPNFIPGHAYLGLSYIQKGMYENAVSEFQESVMLSSRSPLYLAGLAHAYAVAGKREEALKIIEELKELSKKNYVPAFSIALIYIGLDEREEAISWLEKAVEERYFRVLNIKVDPRFDSLHSDSRYKALLKKMGL
jgi:serine/threonine-protein kinase